MKTGNAEKDFTAPPTFAKHAYLVKKYFIANRPAVHAQNQSPIVATVWTGIRNWLFELFLQSIIFFFIWTDSKLMIGVIRNFFINVYQWNPPIRPLPLLQSQDNQHGRCSFCHFLAGSSSLYTEIPSDSRILNY